MSYNYTTQKHLQSPDGVQHRNPLYCLYIAASKVPNRPSSLRHVPFEKSKLGKVRNNIWNDIKQDDVSQPKIALSVE